jgi:hypothetical protein
MGPVRRRSRARRLGAASTWLAAGTLLVVGTAGAQTAIRRVTTIDALKQFPGYFHLQTVLLRGEFVERGTELVLRSDAQDISLINPSDVGRLERDDSRLGSYTERRGGREWPRPGTELVLNITGVTEAAAASTPSVRALALEPWRFEGQTVTIVGNFRGRNLFGDLPDAPGKSRYDFVLSGAEGAVWVTGLRPRGRGFDLDVSRRLDTNRWLEITGVVTHERGLVAIAARDVELAKEPQLPKTPPEVLDPIPVAPVEVVFSAPTADEIDVSPNTTVRVQFSKGLRETTLAGRIRVSYLGAAQGESSIGAKMAYDVATRALQLSFERPLEPFRTVKVELLEGITAFDGGPFAPWSLTFSIGPR